jgi:integrase
LGYKQSSKYVEKRFFLDRTPSNDYYIGGEGIQMKSLTREELAKLLDVAAQHSRRDFLMLLVTFNHGLRSSETLALTDANVVGGHLCVQRLKGSRRTTQPLLGDEKELMSLRGRFFPITRMTLWRKIQAYGKAAGIPEHLLHAHALKHSCGRQAYKGGMGVAEIQTYLGHVSGSSTMIYLQADEGESCSAFAAAVGK